MTTLLSTFPVQQPFQFVPYSGPPKQTPRRLPTKNKALSGDDDARGDGVELAHAAHAVEVFDLTCSSYSEADYENSGSGRESNEFGGRFNRSRQITDSRIDGASDDETSNDGDRADGGDWSGVGERNDDWPLPHRERSVNSEQNGHAGEIPFGTLETLNQDYTAERDIPSSIDDHRVHPMADDGEEAEYLSQRADPSARNTSGDLTPMLDKSEVIDLTDLGKDDFSTRRRRNGTNMDIFGAGDESSDDDEGEAKRRCPSPGSRSSTVLQDASYSALPSSATSQSLSPSSGSIQVKEVVPHSDPLFMMDTSISSSDQSLQKGSTRAIQDSMVEPRHPQRSEPASDQGKYSPLRGVSNGRDNNYHNNDNSDDSRKQRMSSPRLVLKRKRDASVGAAGCIRHSHTSSKRSKQRPTKAAHAPKQRNRYLPNCRPQTTSEVPACAYGEVECSEDTVAESSSDSAGNDQDKRQVNAKELQSTDKLVLKWGSASENIEYEVERILAVRLRRGNLMYQVQWVGYEADPEWYSASNFKNSPLKLREFHKANPTVPGPPRRLSHWERCFEEDMDADDFSDDDKPSKTARQGRRAVRLGRAAI
ncbi:hypothetical protein PSPO01_15578 [Paraphaeosphaeria sporulosa]